MIPFTNQMKIKCQLLSDDSLVYEITSGKIMGLKLNFIKIISKELISVVV